MGAIRKFSAEELAELGRQLRSDIPTKDKLEITMNVIDTIHMDCPDAYMGKAQLVGLCIEVCAKEHAYRIPECEWAMFDKVSKTYRALFPDDVGFPQPYYDAHALLLKTKEGRKVLKEIDRITGLA